MKDDLFISADELRMAVDAARHLADARDQLAIAVKMTFPEGAHVRWDHSGRVQSGTVLKAVGDQLYVRNSRTGSQYRITLYDVCCAYGLRDAYHGT